MGKKNKGGMRLLLIVISLFFLFDPYISVIDIIPDIIGYFLMYLALSRLSDINCHMEEARKRFKYAAWTCLARYASLAVLFGLVTESERAVSVLIVTFVFGVSDILIVIPAFKELFEGFSSLGVLCDGKSMYIDKRGRSGYTERISGITYAFIIVRALGAFLPELTSLINNSQYRFVGLLRALSFIIVLAVGAVWLIRTVIFFLRVRRETVFISNICQKHATLVTERPLIFKARRLICGVSVILTGYILSLNIYGNYFNIIPDFICAALILAGVILLRRYSSSWKSVGIFAVIYIVMSSVAWGTSIGFFSKYYPQDAMKNAEIHGKFFSMLALDAISEICFVLLTAALVRFIFDIFTHHASPEGKILSAENDMSASDISKKGKIFCGLCALSGAVTMYYVYSLTSYSSAWYIEMATTITFMCDVLLMGYAYSLFSRIKKEISTRYSAC